MASNKPIYGPVQGSSAYYDDKRNRQIPQLTFPNMSIAQAGNSGKVNTNAILQSTTIKNPIPEVYYSEGSLYNNSGSIRPSVPQGGTSTNVGYSYQKPKAITNYDWDTGAGLLTPDSPLIQPVVYKNEFSPESTMSMAQDIYNEYYADIVAQQQKKNTQAYRDTAADAAATAGAAGMATGSRGSVQLQNQANREAQEANLAYQQQQQLQAFQDTLNARQLELQNKVADYENAWQEVQQYGYVVTEKTGQLLGIVPGQQLTTLDYKTTMSNIAQAVANAEAEKVRLNQQQQQLDMAWAEFQEGIRQYEKDYALNEFQVKNTVTNTLYERVVDMLGRYDTVTPALAALGAQVGMNMQVGSSTAQYMSEAEILAQRNNETSFTNNMTLEQMATSFLPTIKQIGGVSNPATFANWVASQVASGASANTIQGNIDRMSGEELTAIGINDDNTSKKRAMNAVLQLMNTTQGLSGGGLSTSEIQQAEKQLTGSGLFTGSFLNAISTATSGGYSVNYWGRPDRPQNVQRSNITVTDVDGRTRTYTLPTNLSDLYDVANSVSFWNSNTLGIGNASDRQASLAYLAAYFYSNGKLKSNVRLQYY